MLGFKGNARQFYEDALRDALGLVESLSKMAALVGTTNPLKDQARKKITEVASTMLGLTSIDAKYQRIETAATKVGLNN